MRTAMLLLAACATTESTIAEDEADNIAMSIASTLRPAAGGGELGAMLDVAALVRGKLPVGFHEDGSTVRGQHAGLAFGYRVACRDEHNRAIACDPRTTNADVDVTWSGVLMSSALVMVTSREGTWIVNDIDARRMRIDGESHFEYASREARSDDRHELAYDASYRNVVLMHDERWPRGGLVRYEIESKRSRENAHAVSVDARFHASGRATIVLPDHEYELDLTTGLLVRAR